MSDSNRLDRVRTVVEALFPWLVRCGPTEGTGRLKIKSDGAGVDIEGGGPAVARVGDLVVRLSYDGAGGALYYSTSTAAPYVWLPVPSGSVPGVFPPDPTDPGVAVTITTGSARVTCA